VPTGQLPWLDATGDVRVAGLPATFHAFCIDGVQNVSWGGTYTFPEFTSAVNAGPVGGASAAMGVDRANLLTQLLNQFGPADPAAGFASVTDAASFQVCVWEIVTDAERTASGVAFDLAAGRFQVGPTGQSTAAVTQARQWLQSLEVDRALPCCHLVPRLLTSPTAQDQLTWTIQCDTWGDTGQDGLSCGVCPPGKPSPFDNRLKSFPTPGAATSGGGSGLSPAIIRDAGDARGCDDRGRVPVGVLDRVDTLLQAAGAGGGIVVGVAVSRDHRVDVDRAPDEPGVGGGGDLAGKRADALFEGLPVLRVVDVADGGGCGGGGRKRADLLDDAAVQAVVPVAGDFGAGGVRNDYACPFGLFLVATGERLCLSFFGSTCNGLTWTLRGRSSTIMFFLLDF
jgi:hypothetical protein